MSYGQTKVVKQNTGRVIAVGIVRIKAVYAEAAEVGEQSLQSLVPVDTGDLKDSSHARTSSAARQLRDSAGRFTPGSPGIGFIMESFGSKRTGKAYARWVNDGHHTSSGSFVPANPFFSQAVADARAVIEAGLKSGIFR